MLAYIAAIFIFLMTDAAYAQSSWVDRLQSPAGMLCCSNNDGRRLDDPEWRIVGDGFEVLFSEGWIRVPPEAVVTMRNQDGIARVWSVPSEDGHRLVRCFLAGSFG